MTLSDSCYTSGATWSHMEFIFRGNYRRSCIADDSNSFSECSLFYLFSSNPQPPASYCQSLPLCYCYVIDATPMISASGNQVSTRRQLHEAESLPPSQPVTFFPRAWFLIWSSSTVKFATVFY